jgi:hypothetical protein
MACHTAVLGAPSSGITSAAILSVKLAEQTSRPLIVNKCSDCTPM